MAVIVAGRASQLFQLLLYQVAAEIPWEDGIASPVLLSRDRQHVAWRGHRYRRLPPGLAGLQREGVDLAIRVVYDTVSYLYMNLGER